MSPIRVPIYLGREEKNCPEFLRASHLAICQTCGKEYWQHPPYTWGDPTFLLYLHKLCDGSFIKP